MIEEKEILNIAEKEAIKLEYNVKIMDVGMSFHKVPWNKYLPEEDLSEYRLKRKDKLKNKQYWAVYFCPVSQNGIVCLGGDICIFIDAYTGEILAEMRGK